MLMILVGLYSVIVIPLVLERCTNSFYHIVHSDHINMTLLTTNKFAPLSCGFMLHCALPATITTTV